MWTEIVDVILRHFAEGTADKLGVDIGTSSAYLPELLFSRGYAGGLLATDIETSHFPATARRFQDNLPEANIWFGKADAEKMRWVELLEGDRLSLAANSFDFATALNVMHHTHDQAAVFKATAELVKPGGLAIFMGRAEGHLHNLYELSAAVGERYVADSPEPFYSTYNMFQLSEDLEASDDFTVLDTQDQAEYVWIPDEADSRRDYFGAFYALLPLMQSGITRQPLKRKHVESYLTGEFKDSYFPNHGSYVRINGQNYITDFIFQRYVVCLVN
ncbi:MAG TPA: methyltransferase domain-containing protein [Candidatus Saccharimonadales bacterium]|nr:methyltransferase domain-containing protein [Candidatus Saccharimonadales bacterium]